MRILSERCLLLSFPGLPPDAVVVMSNVIIVWRNRRSLCAVYVLTVNLTAPGGPRHV